MKEPKYWVMDGRACKGCTDEQFDRATVLTVSYSYAEALDDAVSQAKAAGIDVEIWGVSGKKPKWIKKVVP